MNRMLDLLRGERRARAFLLTYAQSSLGTGAAAVALFVLAYDRKPSPWSITLVLLAYDLPPGLLRPFVGALPFGQEVPGQELGGRSFLREVREGLQVATRGPLVRTVVIASTGIILFASMLNVAELPLAHDLGVGASGLALLLMAQGLGVVAGSLSGARRGGLGGGKPRHAAGGAAAALGLGRA